MLSKLSKYKHAHAFNSNIQHIKSKNIAIKFFIYILAKKIVKNFTNGNEEIKKAIISKLRVKLGMYFLSIKNNT